MYPDYKNWIPKGMVWSFAAGTAVCLAVTLLVGINWLKIIFLIITIGLALVTLWPGTSTSPREVTVWM